MREMEGLLILVLFHLGTPYLLVIAMFYSFHFDKRCIEYI